MAETKYKTGTKFTSLSSRKTARDAKGHLDFSITKKVIHTDDYEALVTKRSYAHKREALAQALAKKPPAAPAAAKKSSPAAHVLAVRRDESTRSPHVVRLLGEWERSERGASQAAAALGTGGRIAQENPRYIREVARLRAEAQAAYKSNASRITIDLLGKKSRSGRAKRPRNQRSSFSFSGIMDRVSAVIVALPRSVFRWLFEFALSIPLGFLLAFSVLLSLVEAGNRGAVRVARALGNTASWLIQHAFFAVIALFRALLVIPIKLMTLAIAGIYRVLGAAGTYGLVAGRAVCEGAKNYASVFARPPQRLYRKLTVFALIASAAMLPVKFLETAPEQMRLLKGAVLGATKAGYADIASLDLASAQANFSEARASLDELNPSLRALVAVLPAGQDATAAIGAGEELASAGQYLADAISMPANTSATEFLARMSASLSASLPHLASARNHLDAINLDAVPPEHQEQFITAREALPRVNAAIADALSLSTVLSELLGATEPKRYVVLFQNNNELRPAGGFIGSLAFVDVSKGAVTNIDVPGGGSYDFQGYLSEHVKAPKPLSLLNARWELQDANWYPDWPTSAAKVVWFLEHAGFSTVDGVIAVQATTLEKLLALTGPVEFPEQGVTLTSANVLSEIQTAVELEYDKEENKPKAYIGELLPRVLEKLLAANGPDMLATLGLVKSEISEKNILLYFNDQDANQAFKLRGWQPSVAASNTDYLSVIHANIGGGKTDGVIDESWSQEVVIDAEGNATAELTIVREHAGDPGSSFTGVNNVDYARVYAPAGSELISFTGTKPPQPSLFETPQVYYQDDEELARIEGKVIIDEATGTRITNEFGKTVFGNWLQVSPGNVLVAKVAYKLPFSIKPYDLLNPSAKSGYSLILQKQAGSRATPYSISLRYPSDWSIGWSKAAGDG
ncbi:MAG: DUF4012 domain-containing protein, partial [Patescibacteria group bacterium]